MKNFFIFFLAIAVISIFSFAAPIFAEGEGEADQTQIDLGTPDGGGPIGDPTNPDGGGPIGDPTNPDGGGQAFGIFINPLKSGANTLPKVLALILNVLVQVGIALVTIAIIYAGFQYVSARGNSSKIEQAHKTIMGVLIGSAIILGAYVIAEVIEQTVDDLRQNVIIDKYLS